MRRAAAAAALCAAAVSLAACSALDSSGSAGAAREPGKRQAPKRRIFHGHTALVYERSYRICRVFSLREVARQHGVRPGRRRAARAHARTLYEARNFRPAYRGCLDAFRHRPPRA